MALKAGRQINVLQRLHKYLDFKSRMTIYKSFILANFNYCPLVRMFVNKTDFDIIEKVQERALRFIHNDFVSDKRLLLEQSKDISIRLVTMRCLALEVFKCMNGLSPSYIKDLFEINMNSYDLRDNKKLVQPCVKTTLYGLRTIRYYGAHMWNMLPVQYKDCVDVHDFRKLLLTWYGPNCSCSVCTQARRWNIIIFSFYLYHMFIVTCRSPLYICVQCFICMSFYNNSNILCAVSGVRYFMYCIYVL